MRDARLKGRVPRAHVLGRSLVSWSSKKQNSVALSIAKVEYISAGSCCAPILWMKATLNNFGIKFKRVPLLCDNESAIKLTNNLVQHARKKHIDVRHHFIRDHQQKGNICIESVGTEDQLADIFTKLLDEKRFCKLRNELNILDFSNMYWYTPHLYDMPLLRAIQGKSWLACIHPLLKICLVHLVIPHVL
jgi:hypothetical protein